MTKQQKTTWPNLFTWLLIICSLIILAVKCIEPVRSNDLWWHMALGRHILDTGQFIVDHSIFTWTEATSYHVYNAWLAEIALYLIYIATGPIGLIALRYLIFSGFFALAVYFAIKRDIASHPLVWLIITLGTVLSFVVTQVQPELFSFGFMYITVGLYFIIRASGIRAWKLCYLFPVIIILWINSHGAFVMSAMFFASVGIGELLNAKFNTTYAMPVELRVHLFIALALCVIALGINPFGYHLPLFLLQSTITAQTDLTKFSTTITGWDPTSIYNLPPYYALDYLIVAMFIYVFLIWQQLKNKRIDWVVILSFLVYCFLFVKMLRTTHWLAPVFVFTSLDLLAHKDNSWAWPNKQGRLAIALCSATLIGVIGYRTIQGTICLQLSGSLVGGPIITSQYAIEEAEFISKLPNVKTLGNVYGNGGYLMYRLWPAMRIMIDPRYFPFSAWIEQYHKFESGYDIEKFLTKHKPDIWLITHDRPRLIEWFGVSKLWYPLFFGPTGVVFAPVSSSMKQLEISSNVGHTDAILDLYVSFYTALVLKNWSLASSISNRATLIATSRPLCQLYVTLSDDLRRALTGVRAFYDGDYATAAVNLSKPIKFLDLANVATTSYTLLAQRAWNSNDYKLARTMAIEALKITPKNVAFIHNAAIADWQYRKSIAPEQIKVDDDITWQFLVDLLLSHKEKIPSKLSAIIAVITAMQQRTLVDKPHMVIQ